MTNVAVVTDSTADLPADLIETHGIHVIPLNIKFDGETFEDRVTITPQEFMRRLVNTDEFPTTSEPTPDQFFRLYTKLSESYEAIASIHVSSRLSGTVESSMRARERMTNAVAIDVLDSGTASMGTGFLALRAAELAQNGMALEDISRIVQSAQPRIHVLFLADTLEYLRRSGRIGRAAEILGSVVRLKPILRMEEGIIVPHARIRNRRRALQQFVALIDEIPRIEQIAVVNCAGTFDTGWLVDYLARRVDRNAIFTAEMSPLLSAYLGPKAVAVALREAE